MPQTRSTISPLDPQSQLGFERQHAADELGTRVHLVMAAVALAASAGPTSPPEIAWALLAVYSLVRLHNTWRCFPALLRQPQILMLFAFAAWQYLSVLWSPDRSEGLDHAGAARFILIPLALWPVMDRSRALLFALAAGWVLGWLAQLGHATGLIAFDRAADRISGWWDPAVAGTMLMVPLGLALGAAGFGPGLAVRAAGALGLAASLVSILATGTRSAWIAAAGLIPLAAAAWFLRVRLAAPIKLAVALAVVLVTAGGAAALWQPISSRFDEAATALQRITEEGDYETSTGRRVLMYRIAADAFLDAPLLGHGSGSFAHYWETWNQQHERTGTVLAHAHCAPLHIAATTGLVGLALAAATVFFTLRSAARHARSGNAGPLLALLGILFISVFDAVHINAQTAMLLCALIALTSDRLPQQR